MWQVFKTAQGSVILRGKLRDTTTGNGKTGLSSSSSGLVISTIADNEASATTYTQAASHIETIATLGTYAAPTASKCRFKETDATNHPGIYEIQIADARFAVSNAKNLLVSVSGVSGMFDMDGLVPLWSGLDPYMAAPGAANGLAIAGTNAATTFASGSHFVGTVDTLTTYTGNTVQTGDAFARLGSPAGASVSADVAAVKSDTGTIASRITSTLFSGITSLAKWLGAIAGKHADSGTLTEITATTAGASYDNTTDSLEALADGGGGTVTVGGYASGQDPATLVLDVAAGSHNTAGTIGAKINSAASAGDPWSTNIPGSYITPQAGAVLNLILTLLEGAQVYSSSPVAQGGTIQLVRGDDYSHNDGRSLDWLGATANVWPDLTSATITLAVDHKVVCTGTVIAATGSQHVRAEPTAAQTAALPIEGVYHYQVKAQLSSGRIVTLVDGARQCVITDSEAS